VCHPILGLDRGAPSFLHFLVSLLMGCIISCLPSALTKDLSLATGAVSPTLAMLTILCCLMKHQTACRV
jgi:hypothetical protein